MKFSIVIILLFFCNLAIANSDDALCNDLNKFQAEVNKTTPRKIDEGTELISVAVNCQSKIVKYSKRILVKDNEMAKGWRERKLLQHHQLHCNAEGLASKIKWTAMDVIADKNYQYLITLTTTPTDCEN